MIKNNLRIYIHIPFCVKRCNYCSFVSNIFKDNEVLDRYIRYLEKELSIYRSQAPLKPITLYLGGGTPSILPDFLVIKLYKVLAKYIDFSSVKEFTIEANPDSVDKEKAKIWKGIGINRVSLGVQSFNDNLLSFLGRIHNSSEIINAIEILKGYFSNISFDLIYGIPGQDLKIWEDTLNRALKFEPTHISMYALSFDEGTVLSKKIREGEFSMPDEDLYINMYNMGVDFLYSHGFFRYEISNFSLLGYESLHNTGYWTYEDYIGLGVSASSFLVRRRYTNFSTITQYENAINNNRLPIESYDNIDRKTQMGEYTILRLRTQKGIVREEFTSLFGVFPEDVFGKEFSYLISLGYMEETDKGWRLTDDGILISNRIFMEFLK